MNEKDEGYILNQNSLILYGFIKEDIDEWSDDCFSLYKYKSGSKDYKYYGEINDIIQSKLPKELIIENNNEINGGGFEVTTIKTKELKVFIYWSEDSHTLDELKKMNLIKQLGGTCDLYMEETGYSEFSIMGFNDKLKIGGHDLAGIFRQLQNKFITIIIEWK